MRGRRFGINVDPEAAARLPDLAAIRVDSLHGHLFAPHVHVRPEAADQGRGGEDVDALENLGK